MTAGSCHYKGSTRTDSDSVIQCRPNAKNKTVAMTVNGVKRRVEICARQSSLIKLHRSAAWRPRSSFTGPWHEEGDPDHTRRAACSGCVWWAKAGSVRSACEEPDGCRRIRAAAGTGTQAVVWWPGRCLWWLPLWRAAWHPPSGTRGVWWTWIVPLLSHRCGAHPERVRLKEKLTDTYKLREGRTFIGTDR